MIEAVLSFLGGSGVSIISRVMGYFLKKKEMAHDLEVKKLEKEQDAQNHVQEMELRKLSFEQEKILNEQKASMARQEHDFKLDELELINLQKARAQQDKPLSKNAGLWDKVNKSFRPVSAYSLLVLFLVNKFSLLWASFCPDKTNVVSMQDNVWDHRTAVGFWGVMGFYFTNRVFDKAEDFVSNTKKVRS